MASSSARPSGWAKSAQPSAPPTKPTDGSTSETVAPRTQVTQKPVRLEGTSQFSSTMTATVSDASSRTVKAKYPGEVSGASVLFTVTIKNTSRREVDLNALVVNVLDDEEAPANQITSPPASDMPHVVAPGRTARGRYVFVVPKGSRNPITIEASVSAEEPVLVFRGPVG